ncbi:MAG: LPS export ABC transporter permease LptG [Gammaproteobacteria bacterium]|nr:LPS export ABC transporter permease LptG [Gammaproteobacteria bacterium]
MKILDRYIGKSIIGGVLSVLLVLLILDTLVGFAGQSHVIGQAGYSMWHALGYVLLRMPQQLYELFPMIALLGTMVGLGGLANNSELIVIRAAGVSMTQFIVSISKTAFLVVLLAIFIGEVIAPPAIQYAKLQRVKALSRQITLNTDFGLWVRDGDSYVNVRRVETNGILTGITLYTFNEINQLKSLTTAARANYDGEDWYLSNVNRTVFTKKGLKVSHVKKEKWVTLLSPNLVNVVSVSPENLSIWKLVSYIDYLEENGLDSSMYKLSFWTKVFMPITITTMILIAIPFVMGSLRHASIGQRILIGFMGGLGFYLINRLSGQMGIVYGLPAILSAGLPTLLVLMWSLRVTKKLK